MIVTEKKAKELFCPMRMNNPDQLFAKCSGRDCMAFTHVGKAVTKHPGMVMSEEDHGEHALYRCGICNKNRGDE